MIVVYTVGHTDSYDQLLLEKDNVNKMGKTETYPGGWVWKSSEDAAAFLKSPYWDAIDWGDGKSRDPSTFSVYCLQLPNNWEEDTYVSEEATKAGANLLLIDVKIIGKV